MSKPNVATRASSFGGGWVWPLDPAGAYALRIYFEEEPTRLAPLGGLPGYIVEPRDSSDLEIFLSDRKIVWEPR